MTHQHPLQLSGDEMRALGAQVLEIAVRRFETLRDQPVSSRMPSRAETEAALRTPLPVHGEDPRALVDHLMQEVFPKTFHSDHPRFYAFVPSPTNFVSVMGDLLVSTHNVFAGHWLASSTAAQIELVVIDWLKELCGLPGEGGGIMVSGGSMANLCAIATAREAILGGPDERGVLYCSDQTHSSLAKGVRLIGFRRDQRRTVVTDEQLRLSLPALEHMIADDRARGLRPFCVVANGGTTNTGAVDPLPALADLCEREGIWLHVDGAYGAAAVITERGRTALRGLERAHSITLDPHKWLFQPYELGCLLVRDVDTLRAAFRITDDDHADYLEDVRRHVHDEVNFYELGPQLTRSFKAVKLWLSLRTFGLDAFRRAQEVGFEMADEAERVLRADPRWEIVTPSQMAVVTFRWRGDGSLSPHRVDALTQRVVDRMRLDGYALVMSTALGGRPALRICPIHPGTRADEIHEAIRRLTHFSTEIASESSTISPLPHPG
ncbi:MAG: pyridoxal phosphate-dependent decarboxylase family protein [Gemmatimonadaceae bacterium]